MAINAYVGIPGSGKTYEVVRSVILPAFIKGRRIVTNIVGIDEQKFIDYALKQEAKNRDFDPDNLGKIIHVEDSDVLKPNFFPYKGAEEETIAQNGDLICIDEIWRIFDDSKKIHDNHRSFLAEHRHFTNDKGETCDLVVINQSISNIPRFIKDRVESTFRMSKLIALGLRTRYRIDIYSGAKIAKANLVSSIQEKYDKRIFALYKSYDGNNAKEQNIDGRVNYFKSGSFLLLVFGFFLLMFVAVYFLYGYFAKYSDEKEKAEHQEKVMEQSFTQHPVNTVKTAKDKPTPQTSSSLFKADKVSTNWRIVGYLKRDGVNLVILTNEKEIRYEYLSSFKNEGRLMFGFIDGEKVTFYSGRTSGAVRSIKEGGTKWEN